MRFVSIRRILLGLGLGLLLLIGLALALSLQRTPLVALAAELQPADVKQAKDVLRRNDPRQLETGAQRLLSLREQELNLMLGQAAKVYGHAAAQMQLHPGRAHFQASWPVAKLGLWLNLDAELQDGKALPEFTRFRIGRLPLPAGLANWGMKRAMQRLPALLDLPLSDVLLGDMVERVGFAEELLQIKYRWNKDSMARVMSSLWPAAEQQRALAYQAHLAAWVQTLPAGQPVSLASLMPPMFVLAQQRSAGLSAQAAAENRAAILTLALYATGESWARVMPAAQAWPRPLPLQVTLNGRDDFAMHFLVSAALAVEGGGPLADAIGVYKELSDSRGGSGFSFNDIAADRAGTRFGLLSEQSPEKLQSLLSGGLPESAFMPVVSDLPEFLSEGEFLQRYGGVDGRAYKQMIKEIEARLNALALSH
ncbi:hypothetical protein LNV08_21675 [Paucibacter sp. TC2R-5]|uniref:hypothetical protein n=1 Tax=Paucibacter sp. TC2R-5 TaxID=2893555 RepID=UPI0021E3A669|nr:hypothetical protein [Paucibacter sp. TC2R-5]MCV2361582.1 hypothetical protein [Paucibacter sp. TC2R-5]